MHAMNMRPVPPDVRVIDADAPALDHSAARRHRIAFDCHTLQAWQLEPDEDPPAGSAHAPRCAIKCHSRPRFVVLNLTHRCNLACRYCFVDKSDDTEMAIQTAMRAIDLIEPKSPLRIGFFGGEPTLCAATIRGAAIYARHQAQERGTYALFSLTTNATLLDADLIDFVARHSVALIVSLDGPQAAHDRQRRMADGSGSFAPTMAGLERLYRAGRGHCTQLRATYATDDCAELQPGWLTDRAEFLNDLCDRGYAGGVDIAPAWHCQACAGQQVQGPPPQSLAAEYWRVARWYVARRRLKRPARFHAFDLILNRLQTHQTQPSTCGAGNGYVTVNPDGRIYACHREGGTHIGHVDTGIDEQLQANWIDNRWYMRDRCTTCWLRYLCGGGCRHDSIQWQQDIRTPATWSCWLRELTAKCALWIMAELN